MVEGALDSEIFNKFVEINQQCVAKEGNMKRIRPERLRRGDRIGVITPAAPVKREYVEEACRKMEEDYGLSPVVMPHALDKPDGYFASTLENRIDDFKKAWEDPEIKAVLCSRGGYGSVQLIPEIHRFLKNNPELPPKWFIGFSDITIFHSLFTHLGIESIHGPMAKNIATTPNESVRSLFEILMDDLRPSYSLPSHPYNQQGEARGILTGGNFATFNGLAATFTDTLAPEKADDKILFIEDIGENIYEINRMLYRLGIAGVLSKLRGIIVGQFTLYKPDSSFETMEDMIRQTLNRFSVGCPVIYNFPAGHIDNNLPLIMGSEVKISADSENSHIETH